VLEVVVLVDESPDPDWTIFMPVTFVKFEKDIAELLSE
jgi:hypothetical protein